ncbi:MAG: transaldolase, partial [Candidatus Aenigmarchaeota archaeon]|nr:transaldolase [Candidatus Aenigmarchaeota archaeon]
MDIFVDSAELEDIRKARSYGICAGVTTNPSLIKKAAENLKKSGKNVDMEEYIKLICKT